MPAARSFRAARPELRGMMPLDTIVSSFVTLLVVIDPIGLAPMFLALTHGREAATRRRIAVRACVIAALILIGFMLGGNWLLIQLRISLPAFRIAGGLLLFSIASEMIFGVRTERQSKTAEQAREEHARDIAAFPLAVPLMAGPGAISATVLLAGHAGGNAAQLLWLGAVIIANMLVCLGAYLIATRIERLFGMTGINVLSRLLGLLLAALAVQFIVDGIRALLAG
jgi:multiple antibiotic resistance protein